MPLCRVSEQHFLTLRDIRKDFTSFGVDKKIRVFAFIWLKCSQQLIKNRKAIFVRSLHCCTKQTKTVTRRTLLHPVTQRTRFWRLWWKPPIFAVDLDTGRSWWVHVILRNLSAWTYVEPWSVEKNNRYAWDFYLFHASQSRLGRTWWWIGRLPAPKTHQVGIRDTHHKRLKE